MVAPMFDGRETALTQRWVRLLQRLDLWRRLPGDERHPERARVMPGPLRLVMRGKRVEPPDGFEGLWR